MSFESEDDNVEGKFFQIDVPDFLPGEEGDKKLRSYLRLGAPHEKAGEEAAVEYGEDLATLVRGFTDDNRDRGIEKHGEAEHEAGEGPHDVHEGNERAPGHGLTVDQRKKRSADLHTRGGWRDHSDGNRISTTNGDKVEVIRGNYKLIVLGRQASDLLDEEAREHALENGVAWEASGGQVDSADPHYKFGNEANDEKRSRDGALSQAYLEISYRWIGEGPDAGRWFKKQEEGHAEGEAAEHNPIFEENLYFHKLTENKGSKARPIVSIDEKTHAMTLHEEFHVGVLTDNKTCGTLNEGIEATTLNEKKKANHLFEDTQATTAVDIKKFGALAEIVLAGAVSEMKVSAVKAELEAAAVMFEAKLMAVLFEMKLIGVEFNFHPHGKVFKFKAHSTKMEMASTKVKGMEMKACGMETKVGAMKCSSHAAANMMMAPMCCVG